MTEPLLLPFDCPGPFDPNWPLIRISPDGTRVFASGSGDWAVVLDVPSGKPVHRFTKLGRHTGALFLDEDRLIVFGQTGASVWNLADRKEMKWQGEPIPGGDGWLSPDPNVIATGKGRCRLYNIVDRKAVRSFCPPLDRKVMTVGFSPEGRYLAAEACEEPRCYPLVGIWNLTTGRLERIYQLESENECNDVAWSVDGRFAVCTNGFVAVYGPEHVESIGPHYFCVARSLRFSASGRTLEVVAFDGRVAWIDPLTGKARKEEPAPAGHDITDCVVSPTGLVAGVVGQAVLVWRLPQWKDAEPCAAPDRRGISAFPDL